MVYGITSLHVTVLFKKINLFTEKMNYSEKKEPTENYIDVIFVALL